PIGIGLPGAIGPTGPSGPTGPTGATGPAGTGATFLASGLTPLVQRWWTGPSGFFQFYNSTASNEEPARGAPMPIACNLTKIAMYAETTKKGAGDTSGDMITLTILKNNTAVTTCAATGTMVLGEVVKNTCAPDPPVPFSALDTLGLQWNRGSSST